MRSERARALVGTCVVTLAVVASGCSAGDIAAEVGGGDTSPSITAPTFETDATEPANRTPDTAQWGAEEPVADATARSDAPTSVESDVTEEPSEPVGVFGSPCSANVDCLSGWCVEGEDGYICTKGCEQDCPDGFDCKAMQTSGSDVAFLCMPVLEKSCTPCSSAIHCPGGACIVIDGESRCAVLCETQDDCVDGYGCLEDPLAVDETTYCLPLTESCSCRPDFDGGQRSCSVGDEADGGVCYGVSTCDPEVGWGTCSAAPPEPENCDGLDNDCNGLVDDGLEIGAACENTVDGVGSCVGAAACFGPLGWVCQGPQPELEACDYKDNDCDGALDEDFTDEAGNWTLDTDCGGCGVDCGVQIVGGTGVCGGAPEAPVCTVTSCDPGYVNLNDYACGLQPDVSCQPCAEDSDCFAGSCVALDGQKGCVIPCDAETKECPEGYACGLAAGGLERCLPASGSCACTVANAGQLRPCSLSNGVGTCHGVETCDPEEGWIDCTAEIPAEELCDGIDNDCDNIADDGLGGAGLCVNELEGVGACQGAEVCLGPEGWVCQGPMPEAEVCDFADNDCDGAIDEDFTDAMGFWTLPEHCGGCWSTCDDKIEHGVGVCGGDPAAPVCVVASCDDGFVQINDFQCIDPPTVGCQPCPDDAACFGGSCVPIDSESVCVEPCDDGSCDDGFACQALETGEERCLPVSGSCGCSEATAGTTRPCQVANDIGVCVGHQLCDAALGWGACTAVEAAPEICDGVDNDCDGIVDDEPEQAGLPCTNEVDGVGGCSGTTYCLGLEGLVCQAATPESESCDFQDNDCDGATDEAFKSPEGTWTLDAHCGTCGNACENKVSNGVGTCGGSPEAPVCVVASCDEGHVAINDFQCAIPPDVACQACAADDDCFEGTCESLDGQSVCLMPCEAGTCGSGYLCVMVGDLERCVPDSGSCACNTSTAGQVRACQLSNDVGTCLGTETCDEALGWSGCTALAPTAEFCDGLDNDCNGAIDDGLAEQGSACDNTVDGVGTCQGVRICQGQTGWSCQGPMPETEACDFKDNDCDGDTDEEYRDDAGDWTLDEHCGTCGNDCVDKFEHGTGECGGTANSPVCVVASCDDGYMAINAFQCIIPPDTSCQPCASDDVCYGGQCLSLDGTSVCAAPCEVDGDCGEGFACESPEGQSVCVPVTGSCTCGPETAGATRSCAVENTIGACYGAETCDPAAGWSPCDAGVPEVEHCDGIDNDCDGIVDDGLIEGGTCLNDVPGVGACEGVEVCLGAWTCQGQQPTVETCNFKDDDCDGGVDEDFKLGGAWLLDNHCGTCGNTCADKIEHGVGACGGTAAAPVCVAASCDEGYVKINEFQCQLPPDVSCQLCSEDSDCYAGTCEVLDGQAVCLSPCEPDGTCAAGHVCEPGEGGVERCVPVTASCSCNADNAGSKRTCEEGNDAGTCFGVETCDGLAGWGACSAPSPESESCDGYDEDCDGLIDEGVPVGFACTNEVSGIGSCQGVSACFGSQGDKCQGPLPTFEACDYQDNDCDGEVDEDFLVGGIYTTFEHCGACNTSCAIGFPNATETTCQSDGAQAQCVVTGCEEGFVQINDFQCIPDVANICQECATDANCLGADAACVPLAEGSFCGKGCGVDADCPDGFVCDDVGQPSKQCVPSTGSCSCDGSNTSLSVACDKTHTPGDPSQPAYTCTGNKQCTPNGWGQCDLPVEVCDGIDNDCDGQTDSPFKNADGQYDLVEHCGGCGISCLAIQPPNAEAACSTSGLIPQCTYACEAGWFDVNGLSDDGCECAPQDGADLVGDGVDTNCDGIEGDIANSIFVAKNGNDDATGGWEDPLRTIDAAIERAESSGARDVLVATGVYSENVTLRGGVGVHGGFSADFLQRNFAVYETAIIGQGPTDAQPGAVNAFEVGASGDAQPTVLDGFTVFGPSVANTLGANSYAVYIRDCGPELRIAHNRIYGGAGGNGIAGDGGTDGFDAKGGKAGMDASDVGKVSPAGRTCNDGEDMLAGGNGGTALCDDGASPAGGGGGDAYCPLYMLTPVSQENGAAGEGSNGGAGGGAGWDSTISSSSAAECTLCANPPSGNPHSASPGLPGVAGVSGAAGSACQMNNGSVVAGHWSPGSGGTGEDGLHGSGGGGGGAGGGVAVSGAGCTGGNVGAESNCCVAHFGLGCDDPGITACVCELAAAPDPYCCETAWDTICAGEVESFGCGSCAGGPTSDGPNIGGHDLGGSGGGGGGGGCRGLSGSGGGGGGASFGLFVVSEGQALAHIADNVIRTGSGGSGGAGGPGGAGGVGGAGALGGDSGEGTTLLWCAREGGEGGDGGQGGHGGGGGGGCGGASFGIFLWPPTLSTVTDQWLTENDFEVGGQGGYGGPGGASLGQSGASGLDGAFGSTNF